MWDRVRQIVKPTIENTMESREGTGGSCGCSFAHGGPCESSKVSPTVSEQARSGQAETLKLALASVRHTLSTLHGLTAHDGDPAHAFVIDVRNMMKLLDLVSPGPDPVIPPVGQLLEQVSASNLLCAVETALEKGASDTPDPQFVAAIDLVVPRGHVRIVGAEFGHKRLEIEETITKGLGRPQVPVKAGVTLSVSTAHNVIGLLRGYLVEQSKHDT